MEKFCTTFGNVLSELFGLILIVALIAVGVVGALVLYILALLCKYWDLIILSILVYLLWSNVIS